MAACVVNSQLLSPRNLAAEAEARIVAAEVYSALGNWPDALRHASVALESIEMADRIAEGKRSGSVADLGEISLDFEATQANTLASTSQRPDPKNSTYRRRDLKREDATGAALARTGGSPYKTQSIAATPQKPTRPPTSGSAARGLLSTPKDILQATLGSTLKGSSRWSPVDPDTLTIPRELSDLSNQPIAKELQHAKFTMASPEPVLPGKDPLRAVPDASQLVRTVLAVATALMLCRSTEC